MGAPRTFKHQPQLDSGAARSVAAVAPVIAAATLHVKVLDETRDVRLVVEPLAKVHFTQAAHHGTWIVLITRALSSTIQ